MENKYITETDTLSYSYDGGQKALDSVNVKIRRGEMTAVLGGNGAGKSTLFLMMNGVLKPDSGSVIFDGNPVSYNKNGLKELRRRVGIVFQDPNVQIFSADVHSDIAFGPLNLGLSTADAGRRVSESAEMLGISSILDKPAHALSFGQKKRVAIAGVLAMKPDVLILDEPTAGLDPEGVSNILHLLEKIRKETGVTVIVSTHDIDIVPLYCNYVYVMDAGKVVMQGDTADILLRSGELRSHALRLPRISHLMEILKKSDGYDVDERIATISAARGAVKRLLATRSDTNKFDGLRTGFTTGTCAAAAAKAATFYLLTGDVPECAAVTLPSGLQIELEINFAEIGEDFAHCSVIKDAGDDPDITDGIAISAVVRKASGYIVDGGRGIGRVTKAGLKCGIGEAAINPVPMRMIETALKDAAAKCHYEGGLHALIECENGEEIAQRTFNPRLGIMGGISILGTSGIVEPMSEKALIDSIKTEIDVKAAERKDVILITFGNYGKNYAQERYALDIGTGVKCSNFIGEALVYAAQKGIESALIVGHAGKLVKLAGGIMDTHSKTADCRMEIIAAHAGLAGAEKDTVKKLMSAVSVSAAFSVLDEAGIANEVLKSIIEKILFHTNLKIKSEIVMFADGMHDAVESDGTRKLIYKLCGGVK